MWINGIERDITPNANLRDADLSGADLCNAYLCSADLSDADLRGADLRGAYLRGANLRGADLSGANLCSADLSDADLRGADLRGAYLRGADLSDADLRGAELRDANLRDAKSIPPLIAAQTCITPEGDLIGWKKLKNNTLCELRIPAAAKRSNATGRKCRAEFAMVLEGEGVSQHDATFEYVVGKTVRPLKPWCEDRWQECASGIHFFLTREEAEAY